MTEEEKEMEEKKKYQLKSFPGIILLVVFLAECLLVLISHRL